MMAAAPALVAEVEVAKMLSAATHEMMAWAKQPFYSDHRVTTRAWVERDKNGKDHWLTETKTKGFSISNGTVLGLLVVIVGWEVGLAVSKAISGWFGAVGADIKLAAEILAFPLVIAYDEANVVVAVATGVFNNTVAVTSAVWDWLDGRGPVNPNQPASAVRTATMPATAMAGLSDLFRGVISPFSNSSLAIGQRIALAIQNPTK